MKSLLFMIAAATSCCLAQAVFGQNRSQTKTPADVVDLKGFLTEGGLTNIVEGAAFYLHEKDGARALAPQQNLNNRDVIKVGNDGRVEVLLNPSMYLRLAANSEIRFLDLSPDNLRVKLLKGSAILEILTTPYEAKPSSSNDLRAQFSGSYQSVNFSTPAGDFVTTRGGIYRCDVRNYGQAILRVSKGVAAVATSLVKAGMEAPLGDRVPSVKPFNHREDAFDKWSRQRASALVASNKSLRNTEWHRTLRKDLSASLEIKYKESSERLKERLIVTAAGGYVGYVENEVSYQTGKTGWQPLNEGAELNYGDRVRTGPDSRAEINVYPTCYLTLANETEIVYGARSDGGAAIKLLKGSAIIVSTLTRKDGATISLVAPEGEIEIPAGGFYRLNVKPRRESEFLVYDGAASIAGREIKKDSRVIFQGEEYGVWPIRRMDVDPFELWSRKRTSVLYEPRKNSYQQTITPSAIAHRVEWTGMWYLDPAAGAYTFVPGANEYSSPYGGRYSVGFAGRFHR